MLVRVCACVCCSMMDPHLRAAHTDCSHCLCSHTESSLIALKHTQVIKAFGSVNYFIQENVNRINMHHLALFNCEQVRLLISALM